MMPPIMAFSGNDILAKQIDATIDLNRLGEILSSSAYLSYCFCVRHEKQVLNWRYDEEDIGVQVFESIVQLIPDEVGLNVPVSRLSKDIRAIGAKSDVPDPWLYE